MKRREADHAVHLMVSAEKDAGMFRVTSTYEPGVTSHDVVADIDEVWAIAQRHGIAQRAVFFCGGSRKAIVR